MYKFKVLEKVKHENIVELLAIEEELKTDGKIIILCTGDSLFTLLDDLDNTYRLQEGEILLIGKHLTAGMKHVCDNLVHKDLKPVNLNYDGYCIKCKNIFMELHKDQEFISVYRTEECLHPHMYTL